MSLLLPRHVAAARAKEKAAAPARIGGFERPQNSARRVDTDDFISDGDVIDQIAQIPDDRPLPKPVGWRLMLLVLSAPETSEGGVIMVDDHREAKSLSSPQGVVLAMGDAAFKDPGRFDSPWCSVGDRVLFQKYGGRMFQLRSGQHLVFLNDTEIVGVVDGGWIDPEAAANV